MKMRRLLILIAACAVALALAGCGGSSGSSDLIVKEDDDNDDDGRDNNEDDGGGQISGNFFYKGGFLVNENIHPLQDNIDPVGGKSPDIFPATVGSNCPAGTQNTGETVTLFADGAFFEGGGYNPVFPVCLISSDFGAANEPAGGYVLTNGYVYLLKGSVLIGNGAQEDTTPSEAADVTVTIKPGVQIYAVAQTKSTLRVTRGSTLNIMGTKDKPVLFASVAATPGGNIVGDPTNLTGRGLWGGLVIDGYAPTNSVADTGEVPNEIVSEAAPGGAENRYFGGSNPDDSSGTIKYVIIGESGFTFAPDREVQGLTLEAVGSGTTIHHVQIFGSEDDGIEFFGGTVDVSYVVINGQDDDALDFDAGYRGTIQYAIVVQGKGEGENTVEGDNAGPGPDAKPITRPTIANALFLGWGDNSSQGMELRRGFGPTFANVVLADRAVVPGLPDTAVFDDGCFLLNDEVDKAMEARNVAYFCANGTDVGKASNKLFGVWSSGQYDENGDGIGDGTTTYAAFKDPGLTVDPDTYAVSTSVSPVNVATPVADDYMGAVDPNDPTPWWQGWTVQIANQ